MNCPVCDEMRMKEVEKNGVHIDICPQCKGVWLDRGELEKLLEGVRQMQNDYDELATQPNSQKPQYQQPYPEQPYQQPQYQQPYPQQPYQQPQYPNHQPPYNQPPYYQQQPYYGKKDKHYKYKKKKSVFDIFDDLF